MTACLHACASVCPQVCMLRARDRRQIYNNNNNNNNNNGNGNNRIVMRIMITIVYIMIMIMMIVSIMMFIVIIIMSIVIIIISSSSSSIIIIIGSWGAGCERTAIWVGGVRCTTNSARPMAWQMELRDCYRRCPHMHCNGSIMYSCTSNNHTSSGNSTISHAEGGRGHQLHPYLLGLRGGSLLLSPACLQGMLRSPWKGHPRNRKIWLCAQCRMSVLSSV